MTLLLSGCPSALNLLSSTSPLSHKPLTRNGAYLYKGPVTFVSFHRLIQNRSDIETIVNVRGQVYQTVFDKRSPYFKWAKMCEEAFHCEPNLFEDVRFRIVAHLYHNNDSSRNLIEFWSISHSKLRYDLNFFRYNILSF